MAVEVVKTGPGQLQFGETGAETDFSSQVTSITVEPSTDADDDVVVLSGETVPGAITDSYALTGTLFQSLYSSGVLAYSWDHHGEVIPFTFTPNSDAGAIITGSIRMTRLSIGGDVDANAESDFEWSGVGEPAVTWGTPPAP